MVIAKDDDSKFKKAQCPVCDDTWQWQYVEGSKTWGEKEHIMDEKVMIWMLFTSITRTQCKNT